MLPLVLAAVGGYLVYDSLKSKNKFAKGGEIDEDELIDDVIEEMKKDIRGGDTTAIDELLKKIPKKYLLGYLPDENQKNISLNKLVDLVINQIKKDINDGDTTAVDELLRFAPKDYLIGYLPE
jgi:cephalosporin hydroxylase